MTPNEASVVIGCSPMHIRYLCRNGTLKATKRPLRHDPNGFEYSIAPKEVQRYRDNRPKRGPKPKSRKICDKYGQAIAKAS
jgi:hypothetical protein